MAGSMAGRVAFVTGGASGIGRASCLAFAGAGAAVAVCDLDEAGGQQTVALVEAVGGQALLARADISRGDQVQAAVEATVARFGRLDYAHNNAGILGQSGAIPDCPESNWDRVLAVNLTGVFLCMKHEIPQMARAGGGAIVNTSSVLGLGGGAGLPAYAASKHGVIGLTRAAALSCADSGIRVNAVCPGGVNTAMRLESFRGDAEAAARPDTSHPLGRQAEPEEIASAVLWLCSDGASFVTGQALAVDGGLRAR